MSEQLPNYDHYKLATPERDEDEVELDEFDLADMAYDARERDEN